MVIFTRIFHSWIEGLGRANHLLMLILISAVMSLDILIIDNLNWLRNTWMLIIRLIYFLLPFRWIILRFLRLLIRWHMNILMQNSVLSVCRVRHTTTLVNITSHLHSIFHLSSLIYFLSMPFNRTVVKWVASVLCRGILYLSIMHWFLFMISPMATGFHW